MNPVYLSAAVIPLLMTIFIPDAIRDRKTGEFLGFFNWKVTVYFLSIFVIEFVLLTDKFGFELETVIRALAIALMTLGGGIAFTFYSHKHNYGKSLDIRNKKGS